MPVIIHEHRIISLLRDVPRRFRWIVSSILCFLIIGLWLSFFYFPLRLYITQSRHEITLLSSQSETFKNMEQQLSVLEQECDAMHNELVNKKRAMRYHSLDFVLDKASDNGLECVALEPKRVKKQHMLEISCHEIGFKGSFQSLVSYAHELNQEDSFIALHKFEVLRDEDGGVRCSALLKVPRFVGEVI